MLEPQPLALDLAPIDELEQLRPQLPFQQDIGVILQLRP